jgi:nicotinamidase-related amidase
MREKENHMNMKPALLLVDIQLDYFPEGRMQVVGAVPASRAAGKLLAVFRERALPVIHIQHIAARKGATFLLPDTEGIDFHENVKPLPGEIVIRKHYPNSFRGTDLRAELLAKDVKELVICGMMSHMCIDATTRAAFDNGYSCIVAHDACATRNMTFDGIEIPAAHVHGSFMAALGAVYARVSSCAEIIGLLA